MVDKMVLCNKRLENCDLGIFYLTCSLKLLMHIRTGLRIQKKILVSMVFAIKLKWKISKKIFFHFTICLTHLIITNILFHDIFVGVCNRHRFES